jgi:hypothetical protein
VDGSVGTEVSGISRVFPCTVTLKNVTEEFGDKVTVIGLELTGVFGKVELVRLIHVSFTFLLVSTV